MDLLRKNKFRVFSGDPAMGSCVLANDVAVEWWQLLQSPNHESHFRCNQATNKQWQGVSHSVCGSSALWHCLLACRMNLRFNKKCKIRQEVSSAKRLAVLVQDASMRGAVVNRVCTRQSTPHGQWWCNGKAIAVLARRRSEILERCGKLFSFL